MNYFKILISKYGVFFFFAFVGSFIFFSTYGSKTATPTLFPGDIWVNNDKLKLYIPLGMSVISGLVLTIAFEVYRKLRH